MATNKDNAGENIISKIEFAMFDIQCSSGYSLDRARPYDGQPHTDQGERGKAIVVGLTMRDVSDCMVRGFLDAAGKGDTKNPVHDDIYNIDNDKIDFGAVIQNSMCWIEKYMEIFPNVPKLKEREL